MREENQTKAQLIARLKELRWRRAESESASFAVSLYENLIENSPNEIFILDALTLRFLYVNPAALTNLGYTMEEMKGFTLIELTIDLTAEKLDELIAPLREKKKKKLAFQARHKRKDGTPYDAEIHIQLGSDRGRDVFFIVILDITTRNKIQRHLQKMQKLENIGSLAAGIAHDFNNLFMGVYGNISIAKEKLSQGHPSFEFLEFAAESIDRAMHLSSQLLTFAKGSAPAREAVDLGELAKDAAQFNLSGSNVAFTVNRPGDLWTAHVDKCQIQQVFSNLLVNADHAMPHGGALSVTLENETISKGNEIGLEPGNYIKTVIEDEGLGIDPKDINRVFDPFFSTKLTGDGLGLSSVHSIVSKHQGSVGVESQSGKGTRFTLYLPAVGRRQPAKASPVPVGLGRQPSARILVMDDEAMIRRAVSVMLRMNGFSVEAVTDGKEAVEAYRRSTEAGEPFQGVLLDLTIPGGMGGKEAISALLKIDKNVKAIISSGYPNDPVMANYEDYGFKASSPKPYTAAKLLEVLNRVMEMPLS